MKRIAVFASGSGTNAENLVSYFRKTGSCEIALIVTNNPSAGVIAKANRLDVKVSLFSKTELMNGELISSHLQDEKIDFIILAGYLLLVPAVLITNFQNRIINIHPALLPGHGGKGFYGENVHRSVIASGAIMSGITIHYVNEKFDEGEIIFQAACHVDANETSESLAKKIHELEYAYFPVVVEKIIKTQY
jgi:phosphoribosylglycinamide formyltransferase-1